VEPFRLEADLAETLARDFGTPLYVISEESFTSRIRAFKAALGQFTNPTRVSYASKANSTLALLQLAHQNGCHIDVASIGEYTGALRAGIPPRDCTLHGNNKSVEELALPVGEIVIDSFDEIDRLASLPPAADSISLRVNPQLDLGLNPKIATATIFSKFGFPLEAEILSEAILRLRQSGREVTGLHCHLGSQIFQADAHSRAAASMLKTMDQLPEVPWKLLNLGGGFGIRYTHEDPPGSAESLANVAALNLPESLTVGFEPGRSLIGEAGLTLYQVGTIKDVNGVRVVAVDGGLADNPRPAMYDAQYTVEGLGQTDLQPATVVGRHCENDVLHPDVLLPAGLRVGDLIQVLCTGAYSSSMASNYNRYPRPATVLLRESGPLLVQERESFDMMFEREKLIDG